MHKRNALLYIYILFFFLPSLIKDEQGGEQTNSLTADGSNSEETTLAIDEGNSSYLKISR